MFRHPRANGLTVVASAGLLVSTAMTPARRGQMPPQRTTTLPAGSQHISHIVFIVKENHTFDNYFGTFPGADGATTRRLSDGRVVRLGHTPDPLLADIEHTPQAAQTAYDHGKMDGFDKIAGARQESRDVALSQYQALR